eukprot:scaffold12153_cov167-Amphora_coffeaeformis.AAC.2
MNVDKGDKKESVDEGGMVMCDGVVNCYRVDDEEEEEEEEVNEIHHPHTIYQPHAHNMIIFFGFALAHRGRACDVLAGWRRLCFLVMFPKHHQHENELLSSCGVFDGACVAKKKRRMNRLYLLFMPKFTPIAVSRALSSLRTVCWTVEFDVSMVVATREPEHGCLNTKSVVVQTSSFLSSTFLN